MDIKGKIYRIESKDVYVKHPGSNEPVRCSLKGKFKIDNKLKKDKLYQLDTFAVGDNVEFQINKDGSGVIHKVLPRQNHISRKAPKMKGGTYRGERFEQIVAANISLVMVVNSVHNPSFNSRSLDRFLVAVESSGLHPLIVINKIDLADEESLSIVEEITRVYTNIGYKVLHTSTKTGHNIAQLRETLAGETTFIWGHSGVGKSSLANSLFPELDLNVGEISASTNKGTHTTVTVRMHEPAPGTFIIDSPGIREIDPYGITKEDLTHYFREFEAAAENCRYSRCTHTHEPECAIAAAVEAGEISEERYQSYINIYNTIEDDLYF